MRADIANIDKGLTQIIDSLLPKNDLLGILFSFLSMRGYMAKAIWGFLFLFLLYKLKKVWKPLLIDLLAASGTTFIMVEYVLKNLVQRIRPEVPLKAILLCPLDFSFPSTHAAVAFAFAVILDHYDKKRSAIYYILAGLISLSRIYLGCHYLFDIAAGGLFGYITARLILRLKMPGEKPAKKST